MTERAKPLCGVLLIDKPETWTSHDVVAKLRGRLGERRIGHGGTLDPLATGLLVVLVGKAARLMDLLPGTKRYEADLRFGFTSDTLDITGAVEATGGVLPSPAAVRAALEPFRGDIMQVPPMMSALSQNGVRLYKLARQGIEVERQARPVTVSSLEARQTGEDEYTLSLTCSGGTYVRSIIDDLGRALGCGAVMTALRRTGSGPYTLENAHTLETACAEALLPIETALPDIPRLTPEPGDMVKLYQGKALVAREADGLCWLRRGMGETAALGRVSGGELKLFKNFEG